MPNVSVAAWLRLVRTYHKVDRSSVAHLRDWGLSLAQFDVLAHIGVSEGLTQRELAEALLVTKGNVCQLLDRMAEAGLIVRRQDGRANRIFLTERGHRLFDEVVPAHEDRITEVFQALTSAEQHLLYGLLRKLDRALS